MWCDLFGSHHIAWWKKWWCSFRTFLGPVITILCLHEKSGWSLWVSYFLLQLNMREIKMKMTLITAIVTFPIIIVQFHFIKKAIGDFYCPKSSHFFKAFQIIWIVNWNCKTKSYPSYDRTLYEFLTFATLPVCIFYSFLVETFTGKMTKEAILFTAVSTAKGSSK